jgi:hypothetical protein
MAAIEVEPSRRALVRRRTVVVGSGLAGVLVLVAQVLGLRVVSCPQYAATAAQLNWSGSRASMRMASQRRMRRV